MAAGLSCGNHSALTTRSTERKKTLHFRGSVLQGPKPSTPNPYTLNPKTLNPKTLNPKPQNPLHFQSSQWFVGDVVKVAGVGENNFHAENDSVLCIKTRSLGFRV